MNTPFRLKRDADYRPKRKGRAHLIPIPDCRRIDYVPAFLRETPKGIRRRP